MTIHRQTRKGAERLLTGKPELPLPHADVLRLLDGAASIVDIANVLGISAREVERVILRLTLAGLARPAAPPPPKTPDSPSSSSSSSSAAAAAAAAAAPDHQPITSPSSSASFPSAAPSIAKAPTTPAPMPALAAARATLAAAAHEQALADAASHAEKAEILRASALAALESARRAEAEDVARAKARRLARKRRCSRRIAMAACCAGLLLGASWAANLAVAVEPAACSKALSGWLGEPAVVGSCSARALPFPSFSAEGIHAQGLSAERVRGLLAPMALLSGHAIPTRLSISKLRATPAAAKALLERSSGAGLDAPISVELDSSVLDFGSFELAFSSGSALLLPSGDLAFLRLNGPGGLYSVEMNRAQGSSLLRAEARFSDPSAAPLSGLESISAEGRLVDEGFVVDRGLAVHAAGPAHFIGSARWPAKGWSFSAKFSAGAIELGAAAPWLFSAGRASISGMMAGDGPTPSAALGQGFLQAAISARQTSLEVDLPAILGASASGRAVYARADGELWASAEQGQSYVFPALSMGPAMASLRASISTDLERVSGSVKIKNTRRGLSIERSLSGSAARISVNPSR